MVSIAYSGRRLATSSIPRLRLPHGELAIRRQQLRLQTSNPVAHEASFHCNLNKAASTRASPSVLTISPTWSPYPHLSTSSPHRYSAAVGPCPVHATDREESHRYGAPSLALAEIECEDEESKIVNTITISSPTQEYTSFIISIHPFRYAFPFSVFGSGIVRAICSIAIRTKLLRGLPPTYMFCLGVSTN